MDTRTWKYYKIRDLFNISVSKDKNLLSSDFGITPYVSSSANNNGVSCYVDSIPSIDANTITVARNGSVGAAFYQPNMYCASPDDVRILSPKFRITPAIGLFLCTLIEQEKYRYAYGRKFGTKRMLNTRIKLPSKDNIPDWEFIEEYVAKTLIPLLPSKARQVWEGTYNNKPVSTTPTSLDSVKWSYFKLEDIFESIYKGKSYNAQDLVFNALNNSCSIPYVTRTDDNNGIKGFAQNNNLSDIENGNAITIGDTTSTIYYQEQDFICGEHIVILRSRNLNKFRAMFMVSLLNMERFRYCYGRAYTLANIKKTKLLLPVKQDGTPNWVFMEDYIKSLPYSANI